MYVCNEEVYDNRLFCGERNMSNHLQKTTTYMYSFSNNYLHSV